MPAPGRRTRVVEWHRANRRRRRSTPRLIECDLGAPIPAIAEPMPDRMRPRPPRDGVALLRGIVLAFCAAVMVAGFVVALVGGLSIYGARQARAAAPACILDTLSKDAAVDLALALRADLAAAIREISAPALAPDARKILVLRLERRARVADQIIICGEHK